MTNLEKLTEQIQQRIKALRDLQEFVKQHALELEQAETVDLSSHHFDDGEPPTVFLWRFASPKAFCRAIGGHWERRPDGHKIDYAGKVDSFTLYIFEAEPTCTPEPLDFTDEADQSAVLQTEVSQSTTEAA